MGSDSDDVYRVRELLIGDGIQHGPELPSIVHILDTMHPLYRQILENFYKMKAAIEMQQPADDGEEEEVELREIHLVPHTRLRLQAVRHVARVEGARVTIK
ncbi:unnamed protein product [Gongylonema pulchrum]|uniref:Uncharacterized protein n=1 Tax=Gongylonema pulchrum TaxID=637853 RepID=A0A183EMB3_9BILA|nr:unnamed protein product [Gongylonema pulchrum]